MAQYTGDTQTIYEPWKCQVNMTHHKQHLSKTKQSIRKTLLRSHPALISTQLVKLSRINTQDHNDKDSCDNDNDDGNGGECVWEAQRSGRAT